MGTKIPACQRSVQYKPCLVQLGVFEPFKRKREVTDGHLETISNHPSFISTRFVHGMFQEILGIWETISSWEYSMLFVKVHQVLVLLQYVNMSRQWQ